MKIFSMLFCLLLLVPSASSAMTADEIKSAIDQKMRDRHPIPDPTFWSNLGPDSVPVMEQLFQASNSPLEQSWLLDGLSHFSDPSIGPMLEAQIPSSSNAVITKKMLTALIDSQGEASLDFVEPYLKDKDPHIRFAVAMGMQHWMPNNPKAQALLAQFSANEKEPWVKQDFAKNTDHSATQKRSGDAFEANSVLKPLPEKDWVGDWNGVWVSAKKSSAAKLNLTRLEKEKSWKAILKLPRLSAYELKRDGIEVLVYTSTHLHWIEIRNKKDDSVFIGQRKP